MTAESLQQQHGFTLVEALVGIVILSLCVILALRGISQGLDHAQRAEQANAMLQAGRALLAQASVAPALAAGRTQGQTETGYAWILEVRPWPGSPEPAWTRHRAFALRLRIARDVNADAGLELSTVAVAPPAR